MRKNLSHQYKIHRPPLTIRSEQAEYKRCWQKELARYRMPGDRKIRNPALQEHWATTIPSDTHVFADDLTIETTGAHEIYPKLVTFEKQADKYEIKINWSKIKVIINESDYAIQALRKKLHGGYRGITFNNSGTLLGQK